MSIREKIRNLRHIAFRAKARLLYSSGFGKALRETLWQTADEQDGLKQIYYREYEVFEKHTMNHIQDEKAIARFTHEVNTWSRQRDVIYQADGDIIIEPENSLAFYPGRKYIVPTRGNAHEHLTPSFFKALLYKYEHYEHPAYEALVHFDGFVGRNLYHFIDEALNAYLLLQDKGLVSAGTPFLINEKVYRLKYVQYIIGLPEFSNVQWVVQKSGEWIKTKRLYKAFSSNAWFRNSYELLGKYVSKKPHRRIFLNRTAQFQRRLTNNDAIEQLLLAYGFETVYAEQLSYEEQTRVFAETEYLVALHGAGMTNLLYSDLDKVHVMEVFSEGLIHPHFHWFLELLNINYYDAIVGSAFDINWNYHVDEGRFKQQLDAMMRYEPKR